MTDVLVLGSDGLPVRLVQPWAQDKLHFLKRYIDIFTTSMKDKWPRRVYVDLFAGPGKSVIEGTSQEIDGSPIIALHAKYPFSEMYLNDAAPEVTAALIARLGRPPPANTFVSTLDCNAAALNARRMLVAGADNARTIGLAFIDPTAFQIGYDAIAHLTADLRIDIIVTVMTGYVARFIAERGFEDPMDQFFGSGDWRALVEAKAGGERVTSRRLLDHYEGRLRALGYTYFDDSVRIVNSRNRTIYHLVFASKHQLGGRFSKEVSRRMRSGQARMDI
ncbi:MAG TPA: three-Cys-motif partner protein TcmP [Dehalococcoidia bacterium]|nr:three-Cys-motif partner protein TcmP [Dehalococcoidia bacterium]